MPPRARYFKQSRTGRVYIPCKDRHTLPVLRLGGRGRQSHSVAGDLHQALLKQRFSVVDERAHSTLLVYALKIIVRGNRRQCFYDENYDPAGVLD